MDEIRVRILFEDIKELVKQGKYGDELATKYIEAGNLAVEADPILALGLYSKALHVKGITRRTTIGLIADLADMARTLELSGKSKEADKYLATIGITKQDQND